MTGFRLYGSFAKVQEQDDGTIKVYGIASSGARDEAGEIILPEAIKAALPDYLKFANIRSMHQPDAVGTALEMGVDDDGVTRIVAHVVDPVAITKVKAKVFKGFSVGGKVLARDPSDRTVITKLRLSEVSLVDRPANPDAVIDLWKLDQGRPSTAGLRERGSSSAGSRSPVGEDLASQLEKAVARAELLLEGADEVRQERADIDRRLSKIEGEGASRSAAVSDLLKALSGSEPLGTLAKYCLALEDRLAKLEAEPAPSKVAGSVHAVSKAGDASPGGRPDVPQSALVDALASMSDDERALLLTKAALQRPIS